MNPINHPAIVWFITGTFCLIYSTIGLLGFWLPGIADLVGFSETIPDKYLYLIGAIAIFFEGIYVIGNFIPGSTFIIIMAMLALSKGTWPFLLTIGSVFIAWCLAGLVNIYLSSRLVAKRDVPLLIEIKANDRPLTTWYPVFRSSYEVAQILAGVPARKVFWSSVRVKFLASIAAAFYAIGIPYIIDIQTMTNNEGFWSGLVIAGICFAVGGWIWWSNKRRESS